ncbi:MAG: hypothetical protein P0S95_03555 [Rhabdochlamydiaceae bacterium]|nr:hypothetical protein [Candidatus Amphrikana amoebophyrae]
MKLFIFLSAYFRSYTRKNWSRKKIIRHQDKRITKMVKCVSRRSHFYRELWKGKSKFSDFPIISKSEMMSHFSSINSLGLSKERAFKIAIEGESTRNFDSQYKDVSIGLSSGTSGNRGLFLASKKEQALWAGSILEKILTTSLLRKNSIALFLRANNKLYETLRSKRLQFFYFDLQRPFEELFSELEEKKPKIIVAPPSLLRMLVEAKLQYKPEKIISCAETLDRIDEEIISRYFKMQVDQIYQCTEGFLATTCHHGTLHVNEDLVRIEKEYIDESSGRFLPIITDLYRETQPIIRYRLNDVLVEKKTACQCGSHYMALEKVEGRCDDVLYFKKLDGSTEPIFPDFIRREIIFNNESISDYQVVQTSIDELDVFVEPSIDITTNLEQFFFKKGFQIPKINTVLQPIHRDQKDKKRRIQRGSNV